MNRCFRRVVVPALLLSLAPVAAHAAAPRAIAGSDSVGWLLDAPAHAVTLRVSQPGGAVYEAAGRGVVPPFPLSGAGREALPNGTYVYEVTVLRSPTAETERAAAVLNEARQGVAHSAMAIKRAGDTVAQLATTYSGSFVVENGVARVADPNAVEPRAARTPAKVVAAPKDQVIADDLVVQGSLCVGLDCVANEQFGFDTLRLKENNTRIVFYDTSTSQGFAAHHWQLTANDSANGGLEKFSIEDLTAATVPFTIRGSAPNNSVYVDTQGRVGLRTSTPILDVHMKTSDTPAIRLEQDGSGGFTPQTWDVAGNEANFFVRDVTGGSKLSFRIRPGAPTSSLDIAADGNVGIGTPSPLAAMHIKRSNGAARLRIEETNGAAGINMLSMFNNGDLRIRMENTASATAWALAANSGDFRIASPLTANQLILGLNGNLTISGTLTQGSSRDIKEGFAPIDADATLVAVASLPLYTWSYKAGPSHDRHLGPTAEDFRAALNLGADDKHIAPADLAAAALAGVQALTRKLEERERQMADLESRYRELAGMLEALRATK